MKLKDIKSPSALSEDYKKEIARALASELLYSSQSDSSHTLSLFTMDHPEIKEQDIRKNMNIFVDWLIEKYINQEEQIIRQLINALSIEPVTIYRVQSFTNKRFEDFKNGDLAHLGKYWTYNQKYARAIWDTTQKNTMLLEATVEKRYIDFVSTYAANVYWREYEIRMKPNAIIELKQITDIRNKKVMDFPKALKEYRLKKVKK